ncbi:MAG: MFS transporter [Anaerolineales bacterium]
MKSQNFPISLPRLIFFTFSRTIFNTMYRMVYPFLGVFQANLGVSLEQLSLLMTVRSGLGAIVPLFASVGDSHGRRFAMLLGSGLFIGGAALVVFSPTYLMFGLALILTMVGKYIFDPSLLAYVGDKVVYQERGRVMALLELGWSFSFLLGVPIVGFVISRHGWIAPFPLFIALGMVVFIGIYLSVPRIRLNSRLQGERHQILQVFTSTLALNGLLIGLSVSAANEVINLVFGIWLQDTFRMKIAALGAATAVIGISELIGEFMVAAFVDRLGKPRTVMIGIFLNSLASLGLPILAHSAGGAILGLFLFYVTFEFTLVSSIPLMSELLPNTRATMLSATGASHSLGRAVGALFAAQLYRFGLSANLICSILLNSVALAALLLLVRRKSL